MTTSLRNLYLPILAALLLMGCSEDAAIFELSAAADAGGCYVEQFPFEPTFFALTPTGQGAFIRMEREARMRTGADALILSLEGDGTDLTGQTVTLDPQDSGSYGLVRFLQSCPDSFLNVQIRGSVTFDRYGTDDGDIISGSLEGELVEIRVRDEPDGPSATFTPIGAISGTFSFEMHQGPPYQSFTSPPKQP